MTNADLTWNRARLEGGGAQRDGDVALSALLRFHGLAMNGGVLHAAGCLTPAELAAAVRGYTFYGFDGIVPIIEAARHVPAYGDEAGELESRLDGEYAATLSDGDTARSDLERGGRSRPRAPSPASWGASRPGCRRGTPRSMDGAMRATRRSLEDEVRDLCAM